MKRKKPSSFQPPKLIQKIETALLEFLDWIAPVVDWVGDQAEKYKAASDAVPPPSKRWIHRRKINTGKATVTIFLAFLTIMSATALYLPNRPTWSELEQRQLTPFPKVSASGVLSGSFFDDVNTWFADTFPMRERFRKWQRIMQAGYGLRGRSIVGDVTAADEIPDPVKPSHSPSSTPTSNTDPDTDPGDTSSSSSAPAASSGDASSSAPVQDSTHSQRDPASPDESEISDDDIKTLGALLVIKNAAYEYYNFVQSTADDYISLINRAGSQLRGVAHVYDMVVPTSIDICVPQKVRKGINSSDQKAALKYLYSSLSDDVTPVELIDLLLQHQQQDEYLYFRTDHHWTALAAYYAYSAFAETAGFSPAPLSSYQESVFEHFTGSFFRETENSSMQDHPDTIYAYGPKSTNTMHLTTSEGSELTHDLIADGSQMPDSAKYLSFIGGDNPFAVIQNPDRNDGSAILLIKDSFGNCFAPFLVENYQYVYMVDFRNFNDIDNRHLLSLAQDLDVDDVLFLHSISSTRSSSDVSQMDSFVG